MGLGKGENKGARSYKGEVIGDSMAVTINFKWLIQIIILVAVVTFSFWTIEGRIQELERKMVLAMEEIELHDKERIRSQEAHEKQLEAEVSLLKKELNINPFSWGKKK